MKLLTVYIWLRQEEGLNAPHNLAMEATYINHNFSQQVLKDESHELENKNPFVQGEYLSVCDWYNVLYLK